MKPSIKYLKTGKHLAWLDVLRLVAVIGVVVIHTASGMVYGLFDYPNSVYILEIYEALCRWCVPIFVMISGLLFLNSTKPFKIILSQNFIRLMAAFVFWAIIFNVLLFVNKKPLTLFYFHLWFLPMLAGIYLLIPFLRMIAEQRKLLLYFLFLWISSVILLPQLLQGVSLLSSSLAIYLHEYSLAFELYFPMGFTGYFLLGYYLIVF